MKHKFCIFFSLLFIAILSINAAKAMTFEEAMNLSKPMAVIIYADWADNYKEILQTFRSKQEQYDAKYNFVELDIAKPETKIFNKRYHIYPNLPYVLLFKDKTKISRYLNADCIMNNSCFNERLDMFAN